MPVPRIVWRLLIPVTSLFASTAAYYVWWTEEAFKRDRHRSIERDIKREKWRRRQLGLPEEDPLDDGFASKYLEKS